MCWQHFVGNKSRMEGGWEEAGEGGSMVCGGDGEEGVGVVVVEGGGEAGGTAADE